MARTYTQQALDIVDHLLVVAKRDNTVCRSRGVAIHPTGYIFLDDNRIGRDAAIQALASLLEQEQIAMEAADKPAKKKSAIKAPKQMTWDNLNEATRAYFHEIAKVIGDDKNVDVKPGLKNAPRLSNLKRAGLIIKNGKGVELTDLGKEIAARA
jgi:hypothetical protein